MHRNLCLLVSFCVVVVKILVDKFSKISSYHLVLAFGRFTNFNDLLSYFDFYFGIFSEPRGGSLEALEPVLKSYYNSINGRSKPTFGRKKRVKKSDQNDIKAGGAAFLAVCRGKVFHGDFLQHCPKILLPSSKSDNKWNIALPHNLDLLFVQGLQI